MSDQWDDLLRELVMPILDSMLRFADDPLSGVYEFAAREIASAIAARREL